MAKFRANHAINLKKEKKELTAGDEIELTLKRVEEIHNALLDMEDWKHIVPVFERIDE